MAYSGDPYPSYDPANDPVRDPAYANTPNPAYVNAPDPRPYYAPEREILREVEAGPFRFGFRDGLMGIVGIFAVLGLVLGILGFAAAFALDNAAAELNDGDGGNTPEDVAARNALLPAVLVSMLPFMAAPVLAVGVGAWAGHASRDATIGSITGGVGSFIGPIVMLLLAGAGFALGAGAAGLDLSDVRIMDGWGIPPGWASTIPYLFTGAGLLWLLANTIGGALTGGIVGGVLEHRWFTRKPHYGRQGRYARRMSRY